MDLMDTITATMAVVVWFGPQDRRLRLLLHVCMKKEEKIAMGTARTQLCVCVNSRY